jgi:DNA-binding IclR family transcriptional regulator
MQTAEGPGTRRHTPSPELVIRAMREFDELPALRLTLDQAARLLSLDRETCEDVLESLVEGQLLNRDRAGHYFAPHRDTHIPH